MTDPTAPDGVAHARVYDALLVPAEFARWAPRVADAARLAAGERVLDVACGTGALTREAARRVGPRGTVAGLDVDPGMLTVAGERAPEIAWRQGTAERLPFGDAAFDVVLCQFGLMFVPDRAAAAREMLRVLVGGGRVAVAVWDRLERTPAYAALVDVTAGVAGAPAADALRAPFAMGDRAALGALFAAAGAREVAVTTQTAPSDFPGVRALVESELRGWLPAAGIALDAERVEAIAAETERRLARHVAADGRLRFPSSAHVLTARR
ncbi:methyltransferase domain-containing protein [Roseisolibacter sp. H3M3-2]|uniref:methyltransferase domain-containing protein n=1 Tax=Roseisolibacter sp. H3M3-2 TaxID=3031323 RepID=UPI0023DA1D8E|nr:methyltransferase domain-containing protein [Roseisolibacter sp. H3M3-2]MDF1505036.1 class I SAM-dependent methyltransferase [Roseisolibacter sp. H3M3-2]